MTSRPTLAALLRDRSRSARARFVAALYAARGATTRVDGCVVHVDGERYLVASRWSVLAARLDRRRSERGNRVDRVVAVDPARAARLAARYDARAVSTADLDRLARYGLDRTAADAVYREQFGRPVSAVDPPTPDERVDTDAADSSDARVVGRAPTVGFVAVSTLALLAVVAFSGAGATTGALPIAWDASEAVSVSTPIETGAGSTGDEATTETATARTVHSWLGANTSLPAEFAPGVSNEGVTDVDALAAAHAAFLGNRSYRWELEYVESVNGTVTARGTETVRVASRRSFVADVDWRGVPVGFTPVASQPSYGDGTVRHRPATNRAGLATYALTDLSPAGEQGWRASRYIRWYLSTSESSFERTLIHTERPTAVVEATGTTYPNADDYAVRAHVTEEGFVRSLSVSYELTAADEPPVTVQFNFRYHVDESVSVSPPAWHERGETVTATSVETTATGTTTPNGTTSPAETPTPND
ncbi:hypothetical protein C2R22_17335 [Salinigranum rubrum]|uniref:Uncharacterized protein n=1 Tax=Salinigranum rubrum TaxID=755307 RepID=A0A2I8VPZ6_9EURY|nr:hypothetical protein [Salinigranum rubrum]AUV83189.1 hypothetical protein C2R22_17335 [Salinigranum rubrum]